MEQTAKYKVPTVEEAQKYVKNTLKWPDMSKKEWLNMTYSRGCSKTTMWMSDWLLYGISKNFITIDNVVAAMRSVYGEQKS